MIDIYVVDVQFDEAHNVWHAECEQLGVAAWALTEQEVEEKIDFLITKLMELEEAPAMTH